MRTPIQARELIREMRKPIHFNLVHADIIICRRVAPAVFTIRFEKYFQITYKIRGGWQSYRKLLDG